MARGARGARGGQRGSWAACAHLDRGPLIGGRVARSCPRGCATLSGSAGRLLTGFRAAGDRLAAVSEGSPGTWLDRLVIRPSPDADEEATRFAGFWRYWNPIFGYCLGRYVYRPVSRSAPRWLALLVTFLICGGIHDLVTLLFRGSTRFLFTLWFFFFSLGVILGEVLGLNMAQRSPWFRAAIHLVYLSTCLILAMSAQWLLLR